MIYSGVDLIRQSERMQARAEKLNGPRAVTETKPDEQTSDQQGALLRFARFLSKEHQNKKKKPVSKPGKHPYKQAFAEVIKADDRGQMLNLYA